MVIIQAISAEPHPTIIAFIGAFVCPRALNVQNENATIRQHLLQNALRAIKKRKTIYDVLQPQRMVEAEDLPVWSGFGRGNAQGGTEYSLVDVGYVWVTLQVQARSNRCRTQARSNRCQVQSSAELAPKSAATKAGIDIAQRELKSFGASKTVFSTLIFFDACRVKVEALGEVERPPNDSKVVTVMTSGSDHNDPVADVAQKTCDQQCLRL
jgi:hypothetical protein